MRIQQTSENPVLDEVTYDDDDKSLKTMVPHVLER